MEREIETTQLPIGKEEKTSGSKKSKKPISSVEANNQLKESDLEWRRRKEELRSRKPWENLEKSGFIEKGGLTDMEKLRSILQALKDNENISELDKAREMRVINDLMSFHYVMLIILV